MRYVFAQEENFYYLTGHNERAGLILPAAADSKAKKTISRGPREILFPSRKNPGKRKWNACACCERPGIQAPIGFAGSSVPFSEMRATIEKLAGFIRRSTPFFLREELAAFPRKETVEFG